MAAMNAGVEDESKDRQQHVAFRDIRKSGRVPEDIVEFSDDVAPAVLRDR
jgi:hypothetical protein